MAATASLPLTFEESVSLLDPTPLALVSPIVKPTGSISHSPSSILPSFVVELLLFLPRKIHLAGRFASITVPEQIGAIGREIGRRKVAEATVEKAKHAATVASEAVAAAMADEAAIPSMTALPGGGQSGHTNAALGFNNARSLGGVFNYVTSKWALSILAVGLILRRTRIYAATRRPTTLRWPLRLALRIVPILLFGYEIKRLLQAIRCQTSPQYLTYRHNSGSTKLDSDTIAPGGLLYAVVSTLLFWQDDLQSCYSVKMMPLSSNTSGDSEGSAVKGSLSLLWPLFQTLCLSQFVETLYCTVQGRHVMAETGMTLFEHSLAFAEAEAVVSHQLGWGPFGLSSSNSGSGSETTWRKHNPSPISAVTAIRRSRMLSQFNTTPEVLVVGLISSFSHLTSQVLGIFGLQARFRLWSTGLWGLVFMGVLIWSSIAFSIDSNTSIDFLRFPTVCIVGFVPHMLIIIGIGICAIIYFLALSLIAFSTVFESDQQLSVMERLDQARENLQANMHFSSIRVSRHEDFFSALLKVGFTALTAASEAVFLNEGRPVGVRRWTWLEEERIQEIQRARALRSTTAHDANSDDGDDTVAEGIGLTDDAETSRASFATPLRGGYTREKGIRKLKMGETGAPRMVSGGVGATERSGRWMMVWELFRGITWLVIGWFFTTLAKAFQKCGIHNMPSWMARLLYGKPLSNEGEDTSTRSKPPSLEFWLLSDDGVLSLPRDDQVDVEAEMRKRMRNEDDVIESSDERELDRNIYGWWKQGGWFGELDGSGEYIPEGSGDDCASSVYSESDADGRSEWDTEDDDEEDDGRTTPTRDNPYPTQPRSSPPPDLTRNFSHLAQLLNPKTQAQRQEAQLLSHHLRHPTPLTRSQYRNQVERERRAILTSTRHRPKSFPPPAPSVSGSASSPPASMTPDQEAELLEHLILSRRSSQPLSSSSSSRHHQSHGVHHSSPSPGLVGPNNNNNNNNNNNHDDDDDTSGPPCVVCQTSPRSILVWPCRCLSLCEDCRVALAMNNFATCVCCRRDVLGFSRIYVP